MAPCRGLPPPRLDGVSPYRVACWKLALTFSIDAPISVLLFVRRMKRWQFVLLMIIAAACLVLSLVTIVFARENRKLQEAVQGQQTIINKGALSQQIGTNLVREMAVAAQTDEKMRQLLQANGFNLPPAPTASPRP
jgi:hypothetical protein